MAARARARPRPRARPNPADRYATLVGPLLVAVGVVFAAVGLPHHSGRGWLDLLYVVIGALGIAARGRWARDYALGFGLLLVVLGAWGLVGGWSPGWALAELALGLIGLGAGSAA